MDLETEYIFAVELVDADGNLLEQTILINYSILPFIPSPGLNISFDNEDGECAGYHLKVSSATYSDDDGSLEVVFDTQEIRDEDEYASVIKDFEQMGWEK